MKKKKALALLAAAAMCSTTLLYYPAGIFAAPLPTAAAQEDVEINAANFPDATFRTYVDEKFDTTDDDILTAEEIAAVTWIDFYPEDITTVTDLTGVAYFTALTYLDCSSNQLTSLDVSKNTALTDLECGNNQLTSLDVSGNTALTYLWCDSNQLTSLDVSENTALTYLWCDSNQLTSLDVSKNTALTKLSCYNNQLTSLDVSQNTALTYLYCENNQLTSLDVTNCTELTTIYGRYNTYAIDLVGNTFDLSTLPGDFDVTRASDWSNATVDGTILTISDLQQNIGYLYDLGNGSTEYFELVPQSCTLTEEMFAAIEDRTYTGSEITPDVLFGDVTAEDMGCTVSYADNLHAGTASVTITGDGEFYQGEVTVHFTILPKNVEDLSFTTGAPFVYSGEELTQQVTITDGEVTLTEGVDYRISGNTGTNAGAYIMTITGMGDFTGTYEIPWVIEKAVPEVTPVIEDTVFTEGDALPEISFESIVDGVIEWVTTLVDGLVEGENELEWQFTPEDTDNYEIVTGTMVIEAEATTTTETTTDTTGSTDSTETTTDTTGSTDSTETTTETTGSDLPQTGYSDNYKYILFAAAALVLLGTYAMAKSRKKDEE